MIYPAQNHRRHRRVGRAFTLVEMIFVMVILAICAVFVAAKMSNFFKGRALSSEARRMLTLTHYAQSRAVSEGVPVVLWINPLESTYGIAVQSSFKANDGDDLATTYTLEPSLTLETPVGEVMPTSELDDEKLGLPENMQAIRFNPDGFYDESSLRKITIRQGTNAGLDLVQKANHLGYEILPTTLTN